MRGAPTPTTWENKGEARRAEAAISGALCLAANKFARQSLVAFAIAMIEIPKREVLIFKMTPMEETMATISWPNKANHIIEEIKQIE